MEGIAGGEVFEPFLFLEQERVARRVMHGAREVAELSLDDVTVAAGGRASRWFEVEVELRGDGTEDDLDGLVEALRFDIGRRLAEGERPQGEARDDPAQKQRKENDENEADVDRQVRLHQHRIGKP